MNFNPETGIDGYKIGHRKQFVPNMTLAFGNMTPRKSYRTQVPDGVVFFGLQYFLKEYLIKQWKINFFDKDKNTVVARFARRINNYLGPNTVGTEHIEALHDLGYIPLAFYALPEGSTVPYKVAPFVYFSTHKDFGWMQAYIETIMSTTIWPLSTSATTAKQIREQLEKFAMETVGNIDFVPFQGHNFSYRGCVGHEAAIMIDAGFITSFVGSDTVPGGDFMEEYYNANSDEELISCSVNASEHAVMASYGTENELEAFRRLIEDVYPSGIVSIVSDTTDYWNVITNFTVILKEKILAREGKTVFRPDSGDNVKTIVGYKGFDSDIVSSHGVTLDNLFEEGYEVYKQGGVWFNIVGPNNLDGYPTLEVSKLTNAEVKGTIECLWDIFGGSVNKKGFKELNPKVGAILGDGVNWNVMTSILEGLKAKKFASTNLVFGIGSFYLVYGVSRDTDGWAVKSTYCEVNGAGREIFKDPITDKASLKKSAKGLIAVYKDETGGFFQKDQVSWNEVFDCEYKEVFRDGNLLIDQNLQDIRSRIAQEKTTD